MPRGFGKELFIFFSSAITTAVLFQCFCNTLSKHPAAQHILLNHGNRAARVIMLPLWLRFQTILRLVVSQVFLVYQAYPLFGAVEESQFRSSIKHRNPVSIFAMRSDSELRFRINVAEHIAIFQHTLEMWIVHWWQDSDTSGECWCARWSL